MTFRFLIKIPTLLRLLFLACMARAQSDSLSLNQKDSVYIQQYEDVYFPHKVFHAEPLFVDLIRDLGARKGEKEWNFGSGITDKMKCDTYNLLIEYEFAPVNRLGVEFEIPLTIYGKSKFVSTDSIPKNHVDGLQAAIQWSFYVNEKRAISMAIGYLNRLNMVNEDGPFVYGLPSSNTFFKGYTAFPFYIVAKRWQNHLHSLVYSGVKSVIDFERQSLFHSIHVNTSIHYMIPGTRNFIGLEINKTKTQNQDLHTTIRPQMRLGIAPNFMIGIVTGIPTKKNNEKLSSFIRLVWEPSKNLKHLNRLNEGFI